MAHAHALVAHPVGDREVAAAAGARERRAGQRGGGDGIVGLDRAAEAAEAADQVAPRLGGRAEEDGQHERHDDREDDDGLELLDGLVDDRRGGQREPDRDQPEDADDWMLRSPTTNERQVAAPVAKPGHMFGTTAMTMKSAHHGFHRRVKPVIAVSRWRACSARPPC